MTELWYPPAIKTDLAPESSLGHYTGGAPKGLLHTTESWTGKLYAYGPALSVYRSQGYWPQFSHTIERGFFETYQHIAIDRPGKALEHPAGTGDTNNDNVVQAEICWGANHAGEMPRIMLDGLAAWMRWVEANHGVARQAMAFGTAPPRLAWNVWHAYSGWLGHQHVPANHHTDPGPIDIGYLLGQSQGDDLSMADITAILAKLDDIIAILTTGPANGNPPNDPGVKRIAQSLRTELAALSAKVDKVAIKVGA